MPRRFNFLSEKDALYLRGPDDAVKSKVYASKSKNAVIVDSGFIGVEVASSLTTLRIKAVSSIQ